MNLGRVVKKVVATVKNPAFDGRPLLLVQPLNLHPASPTTLEPWAPTGAEVLCIDFVGADLDEVVLIMKEGSSVQQMLGNKNAPADAAIIGVVDEVHVDHHRLFKKYPHQE